MKKVVAGILVIGLLLCATTVFAQAGFNVTISASKTAANPGDEIIVTVKLNSLVDIPDGIDTIKGKVLVDSDYFEALTENSISGLGTWTNVTFSPDDNHFEISSSELVTGESNICTIKLKLKELAITNETVQISLVDLTTPNGEESISALNAVVSINVVKSQGQEQQQPTEEPDVTPEPVITPADTNTDNSQSNTSKIPQTGENDVIFVLMGVAMLVTVALFVRNITFKEN